MSISRNNDIELLAARLKALSNPGRLQIFRQLALCCETGASCGTDEQAMRRCVGELGRGLDLAPSTVSHHIKELRQAGLVRVERRVTHPLFKKIIRKSKRYHAHDPENSAKTGDIVRIRECRPISKTKTWEILADEAEVGASATAES